MLALIKPLVLTFLKSDKFKVFVVDLLEKLVEQTDNELDDKALAIVKKGLFALMDDFLKEEKKRIKPYAVDGFITKQTYRAMSGRLDHLKKFYKNKQF